MSELKTLSEALTIWKDLREQDSTDRASLEAKWEAAVLIQQLATREGISIQDVIPDAGMLQDLEIDIMNHSEFAED